MKNKLLFTLTLIFVSCFLKQNLYAQTTLALSSDTVKCETEPIDSTTFFNWPYFGNNQYLLNLVDSVEGNNLRGRYVPSVIRIPVTAWVYHLNAGFTDNITNNIVEQYINAINQFYITNNVSIRLYLRCAITHFVDNTF